MQKNKSSLYSSKLEIAFLVLILSMGFALRVYRLEDESIWCDEQFLYHNLHDETTLQDFFRSARSVDPPLTPVYFLWQYAWSRTVGMDILSLRLPSIIFSMLTALLFYVFAKRLYGKGAGLMALFLFCSSNIFIYYAQEIRVYSLVLLLSLLSMDSFHRIQQSRSRLWYGVHYLSSFLLFLTHLFGPLLLLAQGIYLMLIHWRRPWRVAPWAAGHLPAVLMLAWWLSTMDHEALHRVTRIDPTTSVFMVFLRSLTWDACYLPHAIYRGDLGLVAPILTIAILGWWTFFSDKSGALPTVSAGTPRQNFLLLICWLVVPPVALLLLAITRDSLFNTRYVLYGAFALLVIISGAISVVRPVWLRTLSIAGVVILMSWHCLSEYRPFRPNDYASAKWVAENKAPGDRVMSSPPWFALQFLPRFFPGLNLESGHIDIVPPWTDLRKGETLWVVYSRPGWESELVRHEQRLRERHLDFERVRTVVSSHTFVYTSLCYHRLDPYFTVIYRVWVPSSETEGAGKLGGIHDR